MARAGRRMYLARAGYAGNITGIKNQRMYIRGGQPYVGCTAGQAYGKGRQVHVYIYFYLFFIFYFLC